LRLRGIRQNKKSTAEGVRRIAQNTPYSVRRTPYEEKCSTLFSKRSLERRTPAP